MIETDEGARGVFEDNDRLLETVRAARIEILERPDVNAWVAADLLHFATGLGFDVTAAWLSQNIRRGNLKPKEVGGLAVFTDGQVAGVLGKLWDQRRFLTGRFLWAKTPEEVEADAKSLDAFVEVCRYLSETHDSEELDRRFREALLEATRLSMSDAPGDDDKSREAMRAAERYRCATLIRQGAFDFDNLTPDGTEAAHEREDALDAA